VSKDRLERLEEEFSIAQSKIIGLQEAVKDLKSQLTQPDTHDKTHPTCQQVETSCNDDQRKTPTNFFEDDIEKVRSQYDSLAPHQDIGDNDSWTDPKCEHEWTSDGVCMKCGTLRPVRNLAKSKPRKQDPPAKWEPAVNPWNCRIPNKGRPPKSWDGNVLLWWRYGRPTNTKLEGSVISVASWKITSGQCITHWLPITESDEEFRRVLNEENQ